VENSAEENNSLNEDEIPYGVKVLACVVYKVTGEESGNCSQSSESLAEHMNNPLNKNFEKLEFMGEVVWSCNEINDLNGIHYANIYIYEDAEGTYVFRAPRPEVN